MKNPHYEQVIDGEWGQINRKDYKEMCCDCCLVHKVEHRIKDGKLEQRCWRDNKATYAARKRAGIKIVHKGAKK